MKAVRAASIWPVEFDCSTAGPTVSGLCVHAVSAGPANRSIRPVIASAGGMPVTVRGA